VGTHTTIGLVIVGAITVLAGCGRPRQLGSYVVVDPDGMSERMATLCFWGLHDCGKDVAVPGWATVTPASRDPRPSGQVTDDTPTVEQTPTRREAR